MLFLLKIFVVCFVYRVVEEARKAVEEGGNPQWALQLTDLILDSGICPAVSIFKHKQKSLDFMSPAIGSLEWTGLKAYLTF